MLAVAAFQELNNHIRATILGQMQNISTTAESPAGLHYPVFTDGEGKVQRGEGRRVSGSQNPGLPAPHPEVHLTLAHSVLYDGRDWSGDPLGRRLLRGPRKSEMGRPLHP